MNHNLWTSSVRDHPVRPGMSASHLGGIHQLSVGCPLVVLRTVEVWSLQVSFFSFSWLMLGHISLPNWCCSACITRWSYGVALLQYNSDFYSDTHKICITPYICAWICDEDSCVLPSSWIRSLTVFFHQNGGQWLFIGSWMMHAISRLCSSARTPSTFFYWRLAKAYHRQALVFVWPHCSL